MAGQIDIIVAKKAVEELNTAVKGVDAINDSIIKLSKNVRELNKTFSQVKTPQGLEERLKKNEKAQKEVNQEAKESLRLNKALVQSRERLKKVTSQENIELQKNRQETNRTNAAIRASVSAYGKLNSKRLQAKKDLQDLIVRGKKAAQTQKQFQKELLKTQKRFDGYDKRIKKADKATKDFSRNVGNYKGAFGKATVAIKAFLPALGAFTALQIGREVFNVVKELDGLNKALKQVTETSAAFNRAQAFTTDLAEEAGVEFTGLTKSYVKFLASAKTTNLSIEETENIFRQTAKAGAILGLSTDDINGSFRALEQILSKGKVQAEEIRGQLGERLPGAFQILAKSMGLTTAELSKQLELGNVLSEEVLPGFAEELEKTYGLDAVKKVETLTSSVNRLSNAWVLLIKDIEGSEEGLSSFFGFFIDGITGVINRWRDFNEVIQSNASFLDKFTAIVKPIVTFGIATGQLEKIADQNRELRKHNNLVQEAVELTKNLNEGELTRLELLKIGTELDKLSTEQLENFIAALTKKNKIDDESKKILTGSIDAIQEIIKANNELIESTNDDTLRRRLLQENQLLAKQIKLLLKVPEAVKAINAVSVGVVTTEDAAARTRARAAAARNEGTGQVGGNIPSTDDFIEGLTVGTPTDFSTTVLEDITSFVDEYGNQINDAIDITNSFFDNRIERIQQDIDANNEFFQNQIALAEGNEAEQRRLEQERQIKDAELQKKKQKEVQKQAIFNKSIAAANIVLNTATAIVAALAPPPIGLGPVAGIPLATTIGVLGAAQLATVLAAPIPKFKEGTESAPKGLAIVGDGGVSEYIETPKGIFQTPDTDTLVNFKGKEKVHKNLDSLVESKGYDFDAINKAAVMTSIYNDGMKLDTLQLTNVFNDTLKKFNSKIEDKLERGIKRGFKNAEINNTNTTNFDHSIYRNDVL